MRMIIDRFEEDAAIVELRAADGDEPRLISLPRELFGDAEEGDVIELTNLGKVMPDPKEEAPHDIFERLRRKKKH